MKPSRIAVLVVAAALLSGCAAASRADVPAASSASGSTVSTATSASEREHQLNLDVAECMRDRGHVVTLNSDGGWGLILGDFYDSPDETRQLNIDYDACVAGLGPIFEPGTENANIVYDESLIVVECLRNAGFPIDEPPARDAFAREYVARGGFVQWSPYAAIEPDQEKDAVWTCPQ
ncbi:hypothetical protein EYE40_05420 [Glaciihabitans arcticus]|uniref:DUF732 domain-containing protein n=1 Tax=Glaciihabitans arcticus TaxID=2668039 RepID=A0A4Q9GQL8_9MICO|nr:hypothetical protein [Glaciihabitans arcticus]TBN56885.1 hypothetical protein EYE40_05420 [Glaciihabitans arcticus]